MAADTRICDQCEGRRRGDDPPDLDVMDRRQAGGRPIREGDNGVSISTRGIRLTGRQVLPLMAITAASLTFLGWLWISTQTHRQDLAEAAAARAVTMTAEHQAVTRALERAAAATREQTWIMLQPESERARLRLRMTMPRSLRERLADGGGEP